MGNKSKLEWMANNIYAVAATLSDEYLDRYCQAEEARSHAQYELIHLANQLDDYVSRHGRGNILSIETQRLIDLQVTLHDALTHEVQMLGAALNDAGFKPPLTSR